MLTVRAVGVIVAAALLSAAAAFTLNVPFQPGSKTCPAGATVMSGKSRLATEAEAHSDDGPIHWSNLLLDSTIASAWQAAATPVYVTARVLGINMAEQLPRPNMRNKVAVISGGYRGIGRKTANHLAETGITLVLASRDVKKGEQARDEMMRHIRAVDGGQLDIRVMELDLLQPDSIEAFAREFKSKFDRLDVLVNNAGTNIPGVSDKGLDYVFTVSYLGHYHLTTKLYDTIVATPQARVVNMSSLLHRYGSTQWLQAATGKRGSDNYFNALVHSYCDSKLAMMIFTEELRERFAKDGASAMSFAVSPGNVKTDIWRAVPLPLRIPLDLFMRLAFLPAEEGCYTSVMAALAPLDKLGGKDGKTPALYLQPYKGPANKRPWDVAGLFGGAIPSVATLPRNVDQEGKKLWDISGTIMQNAKDGALVARSS